GKGVGAPRLSARPKTVSKVWVLECRSSQSTPPSSLKFQGWCPAPLRAPGTLILPIRPPSFRTSFLTTYLCFIVDSSTLRYI
ncbi:hypothetical protein MTR67_024157, partial [Solanum verrucosum]